MKMRRSIIKIVSQPIISLLLLWLPLSLSQALFAGQQQAAAQEILITTEDSQLQNDLRQDKQVPDSLPQEAHPKAEEPISVSPRQISEQALGQLQADSDMNYQLASPEDNLWVKFQQWLYIKLLDLFGTPAAVNTLEIIIYILILVTLAYAVLRLMKVDVQGLFLRKNKRRTLLQQEDETCENIHEIDFMAAIEEALRGQEYNKAVRLLYLSALKELTDREQIHWQAGKTNFQYQQELTNLRLQAPFRKLGYFFEWAWYGNFHLNERQYQEARTIYQSLQENLQQKA